LHSPNFGTRIALEQRAGIHMWTFVDVRCPEHERGTQVALSCCSGSKGDIAMAKRRKTKSTRTSKSKPMSFIDSSALKSFVDSPTGRQLMADIVLAAAGVAAAALLASNKGGKAMGKAAMLTAQNAAMSIVANALKS